MTQIRIHSHSFQLSDPYSAGRPVGSEELFQLDRLRAENIRNNLAKQMDKEGKWPLKGADLEAFEAKVRLADATYRFPSQSSRQERKGQFDKELESVALDMAFQMLRQAGHLSPSREQLRVAAEGFALTEEAQVEARRRLEAKKEAALEGLEGLL